MAIAIHSSVPAMSHTELFQDIRVWGLVTGFLTKHEGKWYRDKHYWQCKKKTVFLLLGSQGYEPQRELRVVCHRMADDLGLALHVAIGRDTRQVAAKVVQVMDT